MYYYVRLCIIVFVLLIYELEVLDRDMSVYELEIFEREESADS